jgi:GGDEF domain-containing protein
MYLLSPEGRSCDTLTLIVCVLKNTIAVGQRFGHGSGALVARLVAVAVASPPGEA